MCRISVDEVATGGDEEIISASFHAQPDTENGSLLEMTRGRGLYAVTGNDGSLAGASISSGTD
jgi:hypothetical protein